MLGKADGIKPVLQFLPVRREVEEPLIHLLLGDRAVAAPASPGLDLFVGEHGATRFAPVDGGKFTGGQSVFHELREEPLVPLVVPRVVAFEGATPVVGEPHSLDLLGDGGHVPFRNVVRVATFRDGSVFCGHSERIEAHRVEHVKTHQSLEPGNSIADGVVSHVAHVHFPGRIRVHLEAVELGSVAVDVRMKQAGIIPTLLPADFVHGLCVGCHVSSPSTGQPRPLTDTL